MRSTVSWILLAFVVVLSFGTAAFAADDCAAKLTAIQKAAGYITFTGILWVLAIGLLALCASYIIFHYCSWFLRWFKEIPLALYEFLFYGAAVALMVWGHSLRPEVAPFVGLTGCALLAGAVSFTIGLRNIAPKGWAVAGVLAAVWGAAAVWYMSSMIGFLAVGALMTALGFTVMMFGLGYAIGFQDEDALGRATGASFFMLALFVAGRVIGASDPVFKIFEPGALFLGSFVGYLGLLIASSRWYQKRYNYALFQVVTVVAGLAALFIGSVWQIGELQKIGGTFFVLYILEKIFEVPLASRLSYAWLGLAVSGGLWWFSAFVRMHPETIGKYLLLF